MPAFIAGVVSPLIVYYLYPPTLKKTPDAPLQAKAKLASLGKLKYSEIVTLITLLAAIILWVSLWPLHGDWP